MPFSHSVPVDLPALMQTIGQEVAVDNINRARLLALAYAPTSVKCPVPT